MVSTGSSQRHRLPSGALPLGRIALFAAVYAVARLVPVYLVPAGAWQPVQDATASLASGVLSVLGSPVRLVGCSIEVGTSVTNVTTQCLPFTAWALGLALVLTSSRLTLPAKMAWSLAMIVAVSALNVIRIVIVAVLAQHDSGLLEPVHIHVLPAVLALAAITIWLVAERVGPRA